MKINSEISEPKYYNNSVEEVAQLLSTSIETGLIADEKKTRQEQYGLNEFARKKGKSLFSKFLAQFKSFMIIVLLMLAVLEIPALHLIFRLAELNQMQWIWVLCLSVAPLVIMGIFKGLMRLIKPLR